MAIINLLYNVLINELLSVTPPPRRYATNNDYLSAEDLQLFLQAEQGVGLLSGKRTLLYFTWPCSM